MHRPAEARFSRATLTPAISISHKRIIDPFNSSSCSIADYAGLVASERDQVGGDRLCSECFLVSVRLPSPGHDRCLFSTETSIMQLQLGNLLFTIPVYV